jgi:FdhD protein
MSARSQVTWSKNEMKRRFQASHDLRDPIHCSFSLYEFGNILMSRPPSFSNRPYSPANSAAPDTLPRNAELIEETPVAISFGGLTHGIMMLTPCDLDDFLVGFSLSEAIIERAADVLDWTLETTQTPDGLPAYLMDATLTARRQTHYRNRQRQIVGSSGCGLCGSDSLEQAFKPKKPLEPSAVLPDHKLAQLRDQLAEAQELGPRIGAIHAAALIDPNGDLIACREDIGRHNALDKLIGHALRSEYSLTGHTLVMTSRCSVELVNKAVTAGASTLVNFAAPSTLAVDSARRYGLNLIHLARDNQPRVFSP